LPACPLVLLISIPTPRPPQPPLFPYTTLFRSRGGAAPSANVSDRERLRLRRSEWTSALARLVRRAAATGALPLHVRSRHPASLRSEEHTSELQSRGHLVCRLLLEKKNYSRV